MNTNSTSTITPISEITSVSLFSEEELDFSKEYSLINKDKKCSIKCNHCKNNWSSLNTTHKRAHLSDNVFSKLYKVKLCVNVPSKTSKAAVASLKLLQDKRNSKDSIKSQVDSNLMHITTVESVAQSEFNPKRKGTISEKFNVAAATIADRKVANYIFSSKQSFNSCDSLAFYEMIRAVSEAGPGYTAPKSSIISGKLLDEQYSAIKETNARFIERESQLGHGMTLSSDSCTITKQPLTNYICKYPNRQGISLGYDDATELYQAGGIKDANAVYEGLKTKIEEVGPSNVTAVVLDNAPVMLAALTLLAVLYNHLIVLGII
jgi:hypothetical protein